MTAVPPCGGDVRQDRGGRKAVDISDYAAMNSFQRFTM